MTPAASVPVVRSRIEGVNTNAPRPTEPAQPPPGVTAKVVKDAPRLMSQFNIAFSLMSVIPLLICCYLITVKFFSISILEGMNGVYFLFAVLTAVLGLLTGRTVIREIIRRLVDANTKLERLYNQQASFVSNVSHEFRSPLTVIKGALDNLSDGLHGPLIPDQTEPVQMCLREVNRLKRLVSDLLDLARMEAGKLPMHKVEVDLRETLSSVVQFFNALAKERNLQLVGELGTVPAKLTGDPDRLKQVFINLVTNAIKFTEAGTIRVRLAKDGEVFQVQVIDNGRGIDAADLERIFDKFERVGGETQEGSGLGLPIARDIVQLHQGKIWAERNPEGGSRFIVRLPIASQK